eukprot:4695303-Pyramimonas_sp.AAC.1
MQAYRLPRTLRAHGSESKFFVSEQGIVAGCSHTTTVLEFLLCRSMRRLSMTCPTVTVHQLVDDTLLRWGGSIAQCAGEAATAADEAQAALAELRLPVQVKKLGYVASDVATGKA